MTLDARLLRVFHGARVHLPIGELAAELGVATPLIDAALTRLADAGFDIETRPGLGCRILSAPDRLIADDLLARLAGCTLAREILVFEETASTNDVAARLGREGHGGGLAVFAERQTSGRGRFGRRWDSAAHHGLWFSILLRPPWPPAQWVRLTTWAGVGLAGAIESVLGKAVQIKWPNDVLVAGRKVAGILTECSADASGRMFSVVGIGVNVNQEAFPTEIEDRAASLRQIAGRLFDRAALAAHLLRELGARFADAGSNFDRILRDAEGRSPLIGTWVRLHAAGEVVEGAAVGLDADGSLLLRLPDGSLRTMNVGEVTSQPSFVPDSK